MVEKNNLNANKYVKMICHYFTYVIEHFIKKITSNYFYLKSKI